MSDKVKSRVTQKEYTATKDKVVRIVNGLQAATYMLHGAELLDLYPSRDFENNRPLFVYIFNRNETTPLYDLWCKHELK